MSLVLALVMTVVMTVMTTLSFRLTFVKRNKNAISRIIRRHEEIHSLFSTAATYEEVLQIGSVPGSG